MTLVTQTPGYMLNVDPEQVDMHGFHRLVDEGRARLAEHAYEEASAILRQALGLWRGPALADLVETGLAWSELTALQNVRLDVLEDFFEAELARGRHKTVLGQLERMVEDHPMRERSCAQLMVALYRCGRQADALNAFGRVRLALVDELGLEPRRELQTLQHAILNHDETLSFGEVEHRLAIPTRIDSRSAPSMLLDPPRAVVITAPVERRDAVPEPVVVDVLTQEQVSPTQLPAQRKHVAVLMVRTDFDTAEDTNRSAIDNVLDEVTDTIREGVECFGGTIAASIGSVTMALFDMPRQMGN
ncbi:MAG: AfsR/SARP family transcriptional regulator, partial [Actinomycetota bacterium]|nr:AfsR/SARP family transcriptional regulator [Actinomycetota bacterium]